MGFCFIINKNVRKNIKTDEVLIATGSLKTNAMIILYVYKHRAKPFFHTHSHMQVVFYHSGPLGNFFNLNSMLCF